MATASTAVKTSSWKGGLTAQSLELWLVAGDLQSVRSTSFEQGSPQIRRDRLIEEKLFLGLASRSLNWHSQGLSGSKYEKGRLRLSISRLHNQEWPFGPL